MAMGKADNKGAGISIKQLVLSPKTAFYNATGITEANRIKVSKSVSGIPE